jgi:hypothetical protein
MAYATPNHIGNGDVSDVVSINKQAAVHIASKTISDDEKSSGIVISTVDTSGFDQKRTKRLLRKMDFHLIPWLALMYLYVALNDSQSAIFTDSFTE